MTGRFVTLEGIDGAGKTRQARLLAEWLRLETGQPVTLTREPGGTLPGRRIREILREGGLDPLAEALLFLADRAQHTRDVVVPLLLAGEWVVSDRWADSTWVYQLGEVGRALTLGPIDGMARAFRWPALTLVLDLPVPLALQRMQARRDAEGLDRSERQTLEGLNRARRAWLARVEHQSPRCVLVDASGDEVQVAARIRDVVRARLLEGRE